MAKLESKPDLLEALGFVERELMRLAQHDRGVFIGRPIDSEKKHQIAFGVVREAARFRLDADERAKVRDPEPGGEEMTRTTFSGPTSSADAWHRIDTERGQ